MSGYPLSSSKDGSRVMPTDHCERNALQGLDYRGFLTPRIVFLEMTWLSVSIGNI